MNVLYIRIILIVIQYHTDYTMIRLTRDSCTEVIIKINYEKSHRSRYSRL